MEQGGGYYVITAEEWDILVTMGYDVSGFTPYSGGYYAPAGGATYAGFGSYVAYLYSSQGGGF